MVDNVEDLDTVVGYLAERRALTGLRSPKRSSSCSF